MFQTHCVRCRRPLVFPFRPERDKVCDECYRRRTQDDLEEADRDNRLLAHTKANRTSRLDASRLPE